MVACPNRIIDIIQNEHSERLSSTGRTDLGGLKLRIKTSVVSTLNPKGTDLANQDQTQPFGASRRAESTPRRCL
jgi:hypothetical protein